MKKTVMAVIFTVLLFLCLGEVNVIHAQKKGPCCIAGTYEGWHEDTPSPMCNEPSKGKFKLYLYQEKNCGENIKGRIEDSAGGITEFTGKVFPGPGKCCTISCKSIPPAGSTEVITFKGVLCQEPTGKWKSTSGKYENSTGCFGKFGITQI